MGVLDIDPLSIETQVIRFIKTNIEKAEAAGVVLGMSGGVDSSTVATLCTRALGSGKVFALIMPSKTTEPIDVEQAKSLAKTLGIEYEVVDIAPLERTFSQICPHYDPNNLIATGNVKPRLRMMTLYYHANIFNYLVAGTGNKSELLVGYFTKYGDGGVDILPLGDLYKTQVRQLAEHLHIPKYIVWKTPSAGLWTGQTDEGELGIKYETLDLILHGLVDLRMSRESLIEEFRAPPGAVDRVLEMMRRSEHKRRLPPIAKIEIS